MRSCKLGLPARDSRDARGGAIELEGAQAVDASTANISEGRDPFGTSDLSRKGQKEKYGKMQRRREGAGLKTGSMLRGRLPSVLPALAALLGSSSAFVVPMESPPVDRLSLVTPFPAGDAAGTALRLQELAAGRPLVLHLFTG